MFVTPRPSPVPGPGTRYRPAAGWTGNPERGERRQGSGCRKAASAPPLPLPAPADPAGALPPRPALPRPHPGAPARARGRGPGPLTVQRAEAEPRASSAATGVHPRPGPTAGLIPAGPAPLRGGDCARVPARPSLGPRDRNSPAGRGPPAAGAGAGAGCPAPAGAAPPRVRLRVRLSGRRDHPAAPAESGPLSFLGARAPARPRRSRQSVPPGIAVSPGVGAATEPWPAQGPVTSDWRAASSSCTCERTFPPPRRAEAS